MGKVILFLRVSTKEQQLERQEDELRRMALADGHEETDFIVIAYKESAIKLSENEREGLNELKRVIEQENVDTLYITELSRLSRRPDTLFALRDLLFDKKIQLRCQNPDFSLLNKDRTKYDGHAILVFSIFGALAEQEMVEKKERFSTGKRRKAAEGKYVGGAIPFGYRIDKDRDKLIVRDDEKAEIVKLIFDLYEKGFSQQKIVVEMRSRGFNLTLSKVNSILNNQSYTGESIRGKNASKVVISIHRHPHRKISI